ncbi:site-specific integrase, partial [bacterium AH-315-G05]|nr:site-specific integrase [bacterium AH-315-G05]
KEMKILNQEEVLILLKNLKEPLRLVVLIAINTGLRRGEILGLEWSNVDFENKKIHIVNSIVNIRGKALRKETKTSAGRRAISISKSLISELKKTMTKQKENKLWFGADYFGNDYVCVWENGKEINPNYITQAFRKSIMKLEIPHIRFHDLRHTHASLLLQKGIHPKVVQERLGHSKIAITLDTYSHLLPDMQEEAAKKIEEIFGC